jgi:hypothetical protein
MRPQQSVACDTPRWAIDTTCQACRAYLKLESTKGYRQHTVLRLPPCLRGFSTAIVRRDLQLPKTSSTLSAGFWPGKTPGPFSEMMRCVRRALGEPWCFPTPADRKAFSQRSRSLQDTIR